LLAIALIMALSNAAATALAIAIAAFFLLPALWCCQCHCSCCCSCYHYCCHLIVASFVYFAAAVDTVMPTWLSVLCSQQFFGVKYSMNQ